jgi:TRAP-type C4-dicarboxylate transport system permease small subunit
MQEQSLSDPLAAAVAAGSVEAPSTEIPQSPSHAPPLALRAVDVFAETLVIAALLGELILVLANVLARAYLHHSFLWADEVARLSLSILAFIGGAVAYRRRDHAFVRIVLNLLPRPVERVCLALSDVLVLFVAALTGVASAEFFASSWGERTPILQLPATLIALPLPLGMALLALYAMSNLCRETWQTIAGVGGLFILALLAAAATREVWLPWLAATPPSSSRLRFSSSRFLPAYP